MPFNCISRIPDGLPSPDCLSLLVQGAFYQNFHNAILAAWTTSSPVGVQVHSNSLSVCIQRPPPLSGPTHRHLEAPAPRTRREPGICPLPMSQGIVVASKVTRLPAEHVVEVQLLPLASRCDIPLCPISTMKTTATSQWTSSSGCSSGMNSTCIKRPSLPILVHPSQFSSESSGGHNITTPVPRSMESKGSPGGGRVHF